MGPGFRRGRNGGRSRRAARGHPRARRGRCSGADAATAALAGSCEPDGAAAEATLGQRLPAIGDDAGGCARRPDQQLVPPPPEGQGAQAAAAVRLSLSRRDVGQRNRAAARLVLLRQAAADGGAKTAERVRGTWGRGFHPLHLHGPAGRRRPRHRYSRA